MASVQDILGPAPAAPSVSDVLGPRPGSPEASSALVSVTPDDNLARAARDFQSLKGTPFDPTIIQPRDSTLREPTLTERISQNPIVRQLFGSPQVPGADPASSGGQMGVVPLLAQTPAPFVIAPESALARFPAAASAVSKGLMAYFTYQFAAEQPEVLPRLRHALDVGDWSTVRNLATSEVLQGGMTALGLRGAVAGHGQSESAGTPGEQAGRIMQEAVDESRDNPAATAQAIEGTAARGAAAPTVFDVLGEPPAGVQLSGGLQAAYAKLETERAEGLQAQRQAEAARAKAERLPRPTVPETPAEPYETAIEEIRRNEARTTRQVQALFPKRELSRQEAQQLRNAAWGKPAEQAAPAATESGESIEERSSRFEREKDDLISERIKKGIAPQNLVITVNRIPEVPKASFVQVDEFDPNAGNVFSSNPDQVRKLGLSDMPPSSELLKLPAGRYSLDQARELITKATSAAPPAAAAGTGRAFSVTTPLGGNQVSGNYDVVEADQVLSSFDKGYDQRLQPRDRTRQASNQQVLQIMQHFEPQRLGDSPSSDLGAPMVDDKNQVLSGNGRTAAVRALYNTGKDKAYRDYLLQNAKDFGLDPEAIRRMAKPVLVRRVNDYGKLDPVEFARLSNQQQVSGMSTGESAGADARMLTNNPKLLDLFRPNEEGDVLAASNREFLNAFIEGTGERAQLLTKEGYNGPVLEKRVKNAVLAAVLGPESQGLTNTLLESSDKYNLKTASNAVLSSAPALLKFRGTPYDLRGYLGQALKDLVRLRAEGMKLADFLGNQEMFSDRSHFSDLILTDLATERSAAKLARTLQEYARAAGEGLKDVETPNMFGAPAVTREQIVERVYGKRTAEQSAQTQADLPVGSPAPQQPARGEPPGPEDARVVPGAAESGSGGKPSRAGSIAFTAEEVANESTETRAENRTVQGRQQSGALQGRLYGSARAQAQNARALRTGEQSGPGGLAQAAANIAQRRALPPRGVFYPLRKYFAAGTIDAYAGEFAGIMRSALGHEYEFMRQAGFALDPFRKEFDKTPVARNWKYDPSQPLPRNYEVMRAIDTGDTNNLTPAETEFARVMREWFDRAIDMVQAVSPNSLRNLVENYFPRIWRDPEANRELINQLLSRRPWEGPKNFLKKRALQYFSDGLELGLVPVSDNPVDVTMQKLGEMARFSVGRRALEEAKQTGLRKFVYTYEAKPPGWVVVDDPSSTVWAPPTVTIQEAFDETVRVKTLELLEQLGVPHQRLANIGGAGRWGYAEPASGKIVSKFGGPDFVIWHEFGHQMDWRYPELAQRLGALAPNAPIGKELAALADLRYAGKKVSAGYKDYVRQKVEKIANVFDAYLRAPELFRQTAPKVWDEFRRFLDEHPELKNPLNEVTKPTSLVLGSSETEQFVGGPIRLGDWYMPEGAAQVFNNHLQPGLGKYPLFRGLREIAGMVNAVQLLGFFHGQFVFNDVLYSSIGLPLYDVMQGRPARALSTLMRAPAAPVTTFIEGGRVRAAIENPAAASAHYRQIAELATEANLRAGHTNYDPEFYRRWKRAFAEVRSSPSSGALWESLWRTPLAFTDLAMKPVMDMLVPRMKYGVFAPMAARILEDYPHADQAELRRRLAAAADSVEDRLGQVTYDNLFQARFIKDAGQLAFRSYGWNLTKYRMIGGGTADWVKAGTALSRGQAPQVSFRMAYLPAMAIGHALIGGIVMYALSGRRPQKLVDYLFPDTGLVDAYGAPVRVSIADFVKDVVADFRSFPDIRKMGEEWTRKLAPFWSMAAEMYRDQDFWGNRIFSEHQAGEPWAQHLYKHLREGAAYMAGNSQPFSVSAGDRFMQAGADPVLARLGPFLGFVPAPRYATQTKAEALAAELMRASLPKAGLTKDEAVKNRAVAELIRDLRTGAVNTDGQFEQRARAAGIKDTAEVNRLRERVVWTPLQYQVHKMDVDHAMQVFDLATDTERVSLAPFLAEKIQKAYDGKRLDLEKASRYVRLVTPFLRQKQAAGPPAAKPERFSAFTPQ